MYCFKNRSSNKIQAYMELISSPINSKKNKTLKKTRHKLQKPHWNHKYHKTSSGENWALDSTEYFDAWNIFILCVSNQLLNNSQCPMRHLFYFTDEEAESQWDLAPNSKSLRFEFPTVLVGTPLWHPKHPQFLSWAPYVPLGMNQAFLKESHKKTARRGGSIFTSQ